jgi:hypothetical protein
MRGMMKEQHYNVPAEQHEYSEVKNTWGSKGGMMK